MQVCTKKRERFYTGGHWIISSHGRILILVGRSENSKYAFSINRWVGKNHLDKVEFALVKIHEKSYSHALKKVRSIIRIVPCWRPSLHRQSNRSPATLKSFLFLFAVCPVASYSAGPPSKKVSAPETHPSPLSYSFSYIVIVVDP